MPRLLHTPRRSVPAAALASPWVTAWTAALLLGGTMPLRAQLVPPLAAPPAPALAPPPPVVLSPQPGPATAVAAPARFADLNLPGDFAPLPEGGWRLQGALGRGVAEGRDAPAIARLAQALAERTTGRVTVVARVAGPAEDPSAARRDSLAHARALKAVLEAGGLPATRIDLRPLGHSAESVAQDSLDLLPPPAPRAAPAAVPPAAPVPAAPSRAAR